MSVSRMLGMTLFFYASPDGLIRCTLMPEVIVATPLKYSAVTRPYTFADGISIRELSPILWDVSIVRGFVSDRERDDLANTRYWLCASAEYENTYGSAGDELYGSSRHAALALQIICPTGAKHVFLKLQQTKDGWDNVGSSHPKLLCSSFLGRIAELEEQGLEQFDSIYDGIKRAFQEKIVRLQNPVLLLEHGLQIGNHGLTTLMCVMAMDMLFMAGEIGKFVPRVCGFLGTDSFVFPPCGYPQDRPGTKVGDVASDLYDFRNIIAHGQEIPLKPYRQTHDVMGVGGGRINHKDFYYTELMLEAGLFMLTRSLREIFTGSMVDDVADTDRWRTRMRLSENRYKQAGGAEISKQRGR
jgi:hypothetical protein